MIPHWLSLSCLKKSNCGLYFSGHTFFFGTLNVTANALLSKPITAETMNSSSIFRISHTQPPRIAMNTEIVDRYVGVRTTGC